MKDNEIYCNIYLSKSELDSLNTIRFIDKYNKKRGKVFLHITYARIGQAPNNLVDKFQYRKESTTKKHVTKFIKLGFLKRIGPFGSNQYFFNDMKTQNEITIEEYKKERDFQLKNEKKSKNFLPRHARVMREFPSTIEVEDIYITSNKTCANSPNESLKKSIMNKQSATSSPEMKKSIQTIKKKEPAAKQAAPTCKILLYLMKHSDSFWDIPKVWDDDSKRLQQFVIKKVLKKYTEDQVLSALKNLVDGTCFASTKEWFKNPKKCDKRYKNENTLIKLIETDMKYTQFVINGKNIEPNKQFYLQRCKQKQYLDRGVSFELVDNCVLYVNSAERYCERIPLHSKTFQSQITNTINKFNKKKSELNTPQVSTLQDFQNDLLLRFKSMTIQSPERSH